MTSINKVILLGNLGSDVKLSQAGTTQVAKFSLATTTRFKENQTTEWHDISVWGKLADLCSNYLSKGDTVLVEGALKTSKWTDKNGVEKRRTEITASSVNFVKTKGGKNSTKTYSPETTEQDGLSKICEEDIPF